MLDTSLWCLLEVHEMTDKRYKIAWSPCFIGTPYRIYDKDYYTLEEAGAIVIKYRAESTTGRNSWPEIYDTVDKELLGLSYQPQVVEDYSHSNNNTVLGEE